jgi:ammonium transporter, Amt family
MPLLEITPGETAIFTANNIWMMVATFLVFIMHLGFATVESGMCQSKNTTNILFKNTLIPCLGLLTFAAWGFNLMYPGFAEGDSGWFKFAGFGLSQPGGNLSGDASGLYDYASQGYTYWTDFLFQGMFAATAATIVSGAVAERVKFVPFMLFCGFFVGIVYPIFGSWQWGGGWLKKLGFYDFAGSTVVHSIGGWGALAGAIVLGPRIGKYTDGKVNAIPAHNMSLAIIGVFLLWLGWFGFNGGSVLSANPELVSYVLVTTCLAGAAGGVVAPITQFFIGKKFDLGMSINGILAGLVGITAGADSVSVPSAVLIGVIAGVLVVLSVNFFDKIKVDDPVGAVSVHLVCGIWGTLAVGIFSLTPDKTIGKQLAGIGTFALAFPICLAAFYVLKLVLGIRVPAEEEIGGLDPVEHGISAYNIK